MAEFQGRSQSAEEQQQKENVDYHDGGMSGTCGMMTVSKGQAMDTKGNPGLLNKFKLEFVIF